MATGLKPQQLVTGRLHPQYRPPVGHLVTLEGESYIKAPTKAEMLRRLKRLRTSRVARAREHFPTFVEYAFHDEKTGKQLQMQWFHDTWAAAMDKERRLIIVAPRNSGKTSIMVARVVWELGRNPDLRIKIVCAADGKATERLFEVQQQLANPRVKEVFPNLIPADMGSWNKHQIVVERMARHRDASVEALGISSTATGGRADLLVADDIVDRRNAITMPALREQIKHAWKSDWTQLLEPDSRIWYICTLWKRSDLSHELLENPSFTSIFQSIGEDFGSMWPDKWPESALRARHAEIGSIEFNRAFRNIAADVEEGIVKPGWIRYADLSKEEAFTDRIDDLVFLTSYDTAVALELQNDFSASTAVAVDTATGKVYVVDAYHFKVSIREQATRVWEEYQRYQPFRILIEKAGQATLDEWVLNEHPDLAGIVEVTKPKVSKAARLIGITPLLESGRVVFSHHLNPDMPAWDPSRGSVVHELQDFPFGKNDDIMDSLTQALDGARRYFLDAWASAGENVLNIRMSSADYDDDSPYSF